MTGGYLVLELARSSAKGFFAVCPDSICSVVDTTPVQDHVDGVILNHAGGILVAQCGG